MRNVAGVWLLFFETIERTTHSSSAQEAISGRSSLTQRPLSPRLPAGTRSALAAAGCPGFPKEVSTLPALAGEGAAVVRASSSGL
jgi:hypothetical protein